LQRPGLKRALRTSGQTGREIISSFRDPAETFLLNHRRKSNFSCQLHKAGAACPRRIIKRINPPGGKKQKLAKTVEEYA
jgi:hypothetical protein